MINKHIKRQIMGVRTITLLIALLSVSACQTPSHNSTASAPAQSESSEPSMPTNSAVGNEESMDDNNNSQASAESTSDLDQTLNQSLKEFDISIGKPVEVGHIDILTPSGNPEMQVGDSDFGNENDEIDDIVMEDTDLAQQSSSGPTQPENMSSNSTSSVSSSSQGVKSQTSTVPEDIGDGRGDSIVERQIREAALNEQDPELREQLWNEYRKIKNL
jgi:hypothetical protein